MGPHQRDLKGKSAPVYEVNKSHHYSESTTHKSDLGSLQGPIYSTQTKHQFSDGYVAPKARSESKEREEKQKALVSKFFKKEQRKETTKAARAKFESLATEAKEVKVHQSSTSMSMQQSSSMTQQSSSMTSSSSTVQQVSKA